MPVKDVQLPAPPYLYKSVHTRVYERVHVCTHTRAHTHTHMHTHTVAQLVKKLRMKFSSACASASLLLSLALLFWSLISPPLRIRIRTDAHRVWGDRYPEVTASGWRDRLSLAQSSQVALLCCLLAFTAVFLKSGESSSYLCLIFMSPSEIVLP